MSSGFSLKDQLFNREKVEYLAGLFQSADRSFKAQDFVGQTMKELTFLELKQRIVHIATHLERFLSIDFAVAADQILAALPPPLDPNNTDDDFGDFIFAPLGEFVVRNGLSVQHRKLSLKLLHAITQRFSMEYAIRFFINSWPKESLAELKKWSNDKNYHVRRLVSEGTRPMLPWSGRLKIDASYALPLLDVLHADPTRYVTRSVANHLNDISKSNPTVVLETLKRWKTQRKQSATELNWMTRHSLRTLVKQGNADALHLLGFHSNSQIIVSDFELAPSKVKIGEAIDFAFTLHVEKTEALLIDYVIEFVKSNGNLANKIHKIKQIEVVAGESVRVSKRHPFRANATTFKLYPGTHFLRLQINGQSHGRWPFELTTG